MNRDCQNLSVYPVESYQKFYDADALHMMCPVSSIAWLEI